MNEWLGNPVSTDASTRVRGAVLRRIRRRRQAARGAGLAVVLGALALAFWPAPAGLETLALTPPSPPPAPVWVTPPPPAPVRHAPVLMAKAPSRPAERITIYTDDPNVVIVLVADGGE